MAKKNSENLQKSKEKKLQTSEKNRYKALFENTISALFIGKPDGSVLEANDAACKMFGYTIEEFRELGRQGVIAPDTPGLSEKLKEREENNGVTGELIGIRKNGERFWVEFSSSIFEGPNGEKLTSVMMIDISDKKQAEVNLELNEINRKKLVEELSRVFNSVPDIICIAGFDGYFKRINPAASELLGYSEMELLSQPFINFVHPEDVQKTIEELSEIQDNKAKSNLQNRYITKSGKVIWLSWSAKIFYEEKIVYAVAKDITGQKELELLHDQATRLARIGSWELDLQSGEIYWSKITREIHEADPGFNPVLEEGIQFYKEGKSKEKIVKAVKKAIEHGTPWDLELKLVTAKGNERWVRTIGEAEMVDGTCVRIYGSFQDIHEGKESQRKLINKTRQLDAIAKFNGLLIQEEDWIKALEMCLEDFGMAALADRVYFFENEQLEEDDPVTTMRIEWVRDGIQPQKGNPDHHNLPFSEIQSFIQALYDERIYNHRVDEIPDKKFNQFLQDQNILSLLAFPVFTGSLFRGFIGFDDCTIRKVWNQEEVTFLETIVINLASAIENEEADQALQEAFREKNEILESVGDGFFAVDNEFIVHYWNSKAEDLLFTPKEKVLNKNLWDHFDHRQAKKSYKKYKWVLKHRKPVKFEDYYEPIDRWFDVNVYPSENGISVFFKDITEKKESERKIIEKTKQLDAIARFNGRLIKEETALDALENCFEMFGEIVDADRVYYFENDVVEATGEHVTTMIMEWTREGFVPQLDNPEHQNIPLYKNHPSIDIMAENKPYIKIVEEIEDDFFRNLLLEQDIKSVLSIPVFVNQTFSGFIGFDDCRNERVWSDEEIGFLKTISLNLASALENEAAKQQILYKSKLIEAIANINSTFLALENWKEALYQSFRIIGESVNADRVYYFENHTDPETEEIFTSQKLEWVKEEQIIQIDNPDLQNIPLEVYDEFVDQMIKKKAYSEQVRHIQDKNLKSLLESQNILSVLMIPVYVNQQLYGFIGFDVCTYERSWTEEEISFLKTLSANLSHAIEAFQADIELRELYDELELKVKALAASNDELEQFAFVASHDLQEPLRMITSFLALIEKKYGDKLDEKGRSYIYFATDGAKRMRNIILDLLDYSRVGKVEVEKTIVDLNEIIDAVISLNRKSIEEKEAQIIRDDLPSVYAMKNQIQQIFQNLIQNAIHYQKPGHKPVIRISSEESSTEWKLLVEDNGIGIHSDYREKIFNIFQRLHSNQEYSGTGVGLAICKKIVEENGGSIGVESEEGKGSTFYFTLPKK